MMLNLIFGAVLLSMFTKVASAQQSDSLFVFECDTARFGVYYGEEFEQMRFYTPDESYVLHQIVSASGARYASEEEMVEFWNKGKKARIDWKGRKFTNCEPDARELSWFRARLGCVSFRAVGQEPGWLVEIKEQQSSGRLLLNYGIRQLQLKNITRSKSSDEEKSVIFKADTDSIDVTINTRKEKCRDPMNGNLSPYRVTLTTGDREYKGCGRFMNVQSVDNCN